MDSAKRPMIRIGIGGWSFEPWRGLFYPTGLPAADELAYASRRMSTIEINATYYRAQSDATFRRWADTTPEGFVFAVKGPRAVVATRDLAESAARVRRFIEGGVLGLGDKLGPLLWQLPPTKRFHATEISAFVDLLPRVSEGRALCHAIEVRHPSFATPDFVSLMQQARMTIVFADSDTYPQIADTTGDIVYARLMRSAESMITGYAPEALALFAKRFRLWSAGREPADVPRLAPAPPSGPPRDCFVYLINGAKRRAPAAAEALMARLHEAGAVD